MADKKLIATTVSSHEKGLKRREEGKTTSSQRKTSTQGNQDECRMNHTKPEDDSPIQRRDRKHDIDEETRRTDDMRSRVFVVSLGLCFGVVFPETFMSTITFGSSIAVWFMKKVSSFIAQCEVLLTW